MYPAACAFCASPSPYAGNSELNDLPATSWVTTVFDHTGLIRIGDHESGDHTSYESKMHVRIRRTDPGRPDEDRYVVERRVDIVPFTASVALTDDGVPPARPSRQEEGHAREEQREEQEPPCLRIGRR